MEMVVVLPHEALGGIPFLIEHLYPVESDRNPQVVSPVKKLANLAVWSAREAGILPTVQRSFRCSPSDGRDVVCGTQYLSIWRAYTGSELMYHPTL